MLPIMIGMVVGLGVPLQTSINSKLRDAMGSPFVSSQISFLIGTLFLALGLLVAGLPIVVSLDFITHEPAWLWLGGLLGVVYLTSNILLFPKIGAIQTVIFPVLGQIIMGVIVDHFGWFHTAQQPLTLARLAGVLLVIVGVLVTVVLSEHLAKRENQYEPTNVDQERADVSLWLWRILGVVAGMLSACQTAINGQLGLALKSPVRAAYVSFLMGTVLLLLVVLIERPKLTYGQTKGNHPWWMWFGGILGACFVLGNAYLAPTIGTGFAVIVVLFGSMVGSLLIDQFGWLGARKNPVSMVQIIGLITMVLGVGVIRLL